MEKDNVLSGILGFIIGAYLLISEIMSVVFFIGYCKIDSIARIIFVDAWLSHVKGYLWPFFI